MNDTVQQQVQEPFAGNNEQQPAQQPGFDPVANLGQPTDQTVNQQTMTDPVAATPPLDPTPQVDGMQTVPETNLNPVQEPNIPIENVPPINEPANPAAPIEHQDEAFPQEAVPPVETPIQTDPAISAPAQTNAPTPASQPAQTTGTMPTEVDAYKPLEIQAQIAEISPGKFDNLTKVLDILRQGKPNAITIKDSYIHENVSGAVIVADVKSVFDNEVNFQITDPKKHIDLFKTFKGNNNVFILDDPENVRYILTNGPIKIFLPKQIDQLVAETTAPDIQNANVICQKLISKEIRDEIRGISKHSTSIEFLIQENQIKAMHVPDTGIYRFSEFIKDPKVAKLDETNADLVLKSEIFLPVDSDSFNIRIVQKPDTGDFISVTECNAGIVKMWIYEQLENTTGGTIKF